MDVPWASAIMGNCCWLFDGNASLVTLVVWYFEGKPTGLCAVAVLITWRKEFCKGGWAFLWLAGFDVAVMFIWEIHCKQYANDEIMMGNLRQSHASNNCMMGP